MVVSGIGFHDIAPCQQFIAVTDDAIGGMPRCMAWCKHWRNARQQWGIPAEGFHFICCRQDLKTS
ncbi:MAG: hypothetical protein ACR5LF_04470 [Symbiopectobacterium sp.]